MEGTFPRLCGELYNCCCSAKSVMHLQSVVDVHQLQSSTETGGGIRFAELGEVNHASLAYLCRWKHLPRFSVELRNQCFPYGMPVSVGVVPQVYPLSLAVCSVSWLWGIARVCGSPQVWRNLAANEG